MKGGRFKVAAHGSRHQSATYPEIQKWVREQYRFTPKTCWLAHCKELLGLPVRVAWNRRSTQRLVPCPPEKQAAIKKAFQCLSGVGQAGKGWSSRKPR